MEKMGRKASSPTTKRLLEQSRRKKYEKSGKRPVRHCIKMSPELYGQWCELRGTLSNDELLTALLAHPYQNMKNNPVMVNQETQTSALMPGMFQCSRCNSTQASKPMPRLAKIVPSLPSLDPDPEETTYLDHVTQQKISDLAATNPNIKVFAITKSGGKVLRKQEFSRKGNKLVHVSGSQTHRPTISGATVTSRDIPPSMMVSCTEVTNDDGFIEEATPTGQDTNEATLDFIYGADLSTTDIPGTSTEIPAIFPSVDHAETAGPSMTGFQVVEDQCVGGLAEEVKVEDEDKPPELGGLKLSLEVSDDPNAVVIKQEVLSDADPSDAVIDQQVEDEEEELMDEDDFDEEEEEEEEEEEIDYAAEEKADPTYSPRHEVRPPKGKKRKSDSDKQEEDWKPSGSDMSDNESIDSEDEDGDEERSKRRRLRKPRKSPFPAKCPLCPTSYNSYIEREEHIQTHLPLDEGKEAVLAELESLNEKGFKGARFMGWCDDCNKFCFNMPQHIQHCHRPKKPRKTILCPDCGKIFEESQYKAHQQTHVEVPEEDYVQCSKCPSRFKFQHFLDNHYRRMHTEIKRHKVCKTCGKKFLCAGALRRHEVIHTGEKPYPCELCDLSFTQKTNLKTHMRQHTGVQPYVCDVCKAAFTNKVSLKNHKKKAHGIDWWKEKESKMKKFAEATTSEQTEKTE